MMTLPFTITTNNHAHAATALRHTLTLGDVDAWAGFRFVATARLTEAERAALAYSALSSLDDRKAYLVASAAVFGTYGDEVAA